MIGFALQYLLYLLSLIFFSYLATVFLSIEHLRNFEFGETCSPIPLTPTNEAEHEQSVEDEDEITHGPQDQHDQDEGLHQGYQLDFQFHISGQPTLSPSPSPFLSACHIPKQLLSQSSSSTRTKDVFSRQPCPPLRFSSSHSTSVAFRQHRIPPTIKSDMGETCSISILPEAPPSPDKEKIFSEPLSLMSYQSFETLIQRPHARELFTTVPLPIHRMRKNNENHPKEATEPSIDSPGDKAAGPSRKKPSNVTLKPALRMRSPTPPLQAILNSYNCSSSPTPKPSSNPDSPLPAKPSAKGSGKRRASQQNEDYESEKSSKRRRGLTSDTEGTNPCDVAYSKKTPLTSTLKDNVKVLSAWMNPSANKRDSTTRRSTSPLEDRSNGTRKRRKTGGESQILILDSETEAPVTPSRSRIRTPDLSVSPAESDGTILATPPEPEVDRLEHGEQITMASSPRSGLLNPAFPSPSTSATSIDRRSRRKGPPPPLVLTSTADNDTPLPSPSQSTSDHVTTQDHQMSSRVASLVHRGLLDTTSPTTVMFEQVAPDDGADVDSQWNNEPSASRESFRTRKHNRCLRSLSFVVAMVNWTQQLPTQSHSLVHLQQQRFNLIPELHKKVLKYPIRQDLISLQPSPPEKPGHPELPISISPLAGGCRQAKRALDPRYWSPWPRQLVRRDISPNSYSYAEMRVMDDAGKANAARVVDCKRILRTKWESNLVNRHCRRVYRLRRKLYGVGEPHEQQLFEVALRASLNGAISGEYSPQERKLVKAQKDLDIIERTAIRNFEETVPSRIRRIVCSTYLPERSVVGQEPVFAPTGPWAMPISNNPISHDDRVSVCLPGLHGRLPKIVLVPPTPCAGELSSVYFDKQPKNEFLLRPAEIPTPILSMDETEPVDRAWSDVELQEDDNEDSEGSLATSEISSDLEDLEDIPEEADAEAYAAVAELFPEESEADPEPYRHQEPESYERLVMPESFERTTSNADDAEAVYEGALSSAYPLEISPDDDHLDTLSSYDQQRLDILAESARTPILDHQNSEAVSAESLEKDERDLINDGAVDVISKCQVKNRAKRGLMVRFMHLSDKEDKPVEEAAPVIQAFIYVPSAVEDCQVPNAQTSEVTSSNKSQPAPTFTLEPNPSIFPTIPTAESNMSSDEFSDSQDLTTDVANGTPVTALNHLSRSRPDDLTHLARPSSNSRTSRPAPVHTGPTHAFDRAVTRSRTLSSIPASTRRRERGKGVAKGSLGRLWEDHKQNINPAPRSDNASGGGELERQLDLA
ncbi:uncharacterized protein I206_101159 [Kwoniella pini CBS 10737]|uniref:Uncharacterized protein n=1 Tax=Kwoniella pini CBS 10737 TaxID=1296096 RepID=A0A1B9IBU7_9TREE|nr:uncharacterized protein I206_00167 [Kwoniella pini CBS 10737]OCF52867.1 hypothetical protein I206_00167 [Kwoniella pini CBS 10737]